MSRFIILFVACLVTSSCSFRDCAAAPLELFGGHKLAIDLGLRDSGSESLGEALDRAKVEIPESEGFKDTCEVLTDVWMLTH